MKKYLELLTRTPLFRGIDASELDGMLGCLNASAQCYSKHGIVLLEGQPATRVGLLLSGTVQVVKEDYLGNRMIMANFGTGDLFAEAFSCVQSDRLPVTVVSLSDSEVLWLDYRRIYTACSSACRFHTKLIENMLALIATKNILLSRKISVLAKRTTREKLIAYLSDEAELQGNNAFDIPFNRQELADYLCVDRSALSSELSRMQREEILSYNLNHFILYTVR